LSKEAPKDNAKRVNVGTAIGFGGHSTGLFGADIQQLIPASQFFGEQRPAGASQAMLERPGAGTKGHDSDLVFFGVEMESIAADLAVNHTVTMVEDLQALGRANGEIEKQSKADGGLKHWSVVDRSICIAIFARLVKGRAHV
jgi:hypothetical protein